MYDKFCLDSPRFAPDSVTKFYSWAGKRRNMTCWALGEPEPLVVWTRYNWQIKDNETYKVFQMGRHSELQVRNFWNLLAVLTCLITVKKLSRSGKQNIFYSDEHS